MASRLSGNRSVQTAFADLKHCPVPLGTQTHTPVPHFDYVQGVKEVAAGQGLLVKDEKYVTTQDGMRMFGVIDFTRGDDPAGMCTSIGLRNSNDKTMRLGLAAGTKVFVCDNGAFCGTTVVNYIHNGKLRFRDAINDGFAKAVGISRAGLEYMAGVQQLPAIRADRAKAMMIDLYEVGACNSRELVRCWKAFKNSTWTGATQELAWTPWALLQCFTEMHKAKSPWLKLKSSLGLMGLFSREFPVVPSTTLIGEAPVDATVAMHALPA